MIYVNTGSTDVFYNFAAEYYFAREHIMDDDVFMIWRTTPTLMIGKFQNTLEEIDAAYAREHGITVARRLSGGGCIYTDMGGWQFSYITKSSGIEIEFGRFIDPIVDILEQLGCDAALTGRNDITVDGKKVSGNTQYKAGGMTVHHGSLLFSTDIDALVRSSTPNPYKIESKALASVRQRVTNISEHLPHDKKVTSEEFRDIIVEKLTDGEYSLTDGDRERISEIARERFAGEKFIYAAAPKFDIEKTFHISAGTFTVGYSVYHGKITSAGIKGDFFSGVDAEDIENALVGCDFTPESVKKALGRFDGTIYKTDSEELTRAIFD